MKSNKYKHGFKVPSNYFDEFEEKLFNTLESQTLPKETGFKVPEGYFDSFDVSIPSKTIEVIETKVVPLYKKPSFIVAASIAACIAIIFSVINFGNTTSSIDTIDFASLESYIETGNLDIETYELEAMLDQEIIEDLSNTMVTFSDENLEDYLLNNIDDTTLLIE
ncbi:hypothetical protein [Patiriisocius hiemis]|uniref:Uncharacterized protein n=1 Tax=Patiriisocius hiemis TaxID=3075604 RepID=A0ABU2YF59_9FLAO|nr:hypothetical protein [Constantimarinum sp. W242]MDT0556803.1 hypothetical protein [Constantimarinum sp. W242]